MKLSIEKMEIRTCEFCCKENINYVRIEGDKCGLITMAICDKCLDELTKQLREKQK